MTINLDDWIFSQNTLCRICGQDELNYTIVNANGIVSTIPIEIIRANEIEIKNQEIFLSDTLYDYWIRQPYLKKSKEKILEVFDENFALIIENKEIVYSRAEYFLFCHPNFNAGDTIGGGFTFCLGGLLELWDNDKEFYFEELFGYRELYVLRVGGSLLSGTHFAFLWSAAEKRMVHFPARGDNQLPGGFAKQLNKLRNKDLNYPVKLDFHDRILDNLLSEIKGNNSVV